MARHKERQTILTSAESLKNPTPLSSPVMYACGLDRRISERANAGVTPPVVWQGSISPNNSPVSAYPITANKTHLVCYQMSLSSSVDKRISQAWSLHMAMMGGTTVKKYGSTKLLTPRLCSCWRDRVKCCKEQKMYTLRPYSPRPPENITHRACL